MEVDNQRLRDRRLLARLGATMGFHKTAAPTALLASISNGYSRHSCAVIDASCARRKSITGRALSTTAVAVSDSNMRLFGTPTIAREDALKDSEPYFGTGQRQPQRIVVQSAKVAGHGEDVYLVEMRFG